LRIFAKAILRIEPTATDNGDDSAVIVLTLNPIVAAMEARP
jgi:hypothetical protein